MDGFLVLRDPCIVFYYGFWNMVTVTLPVSDHDEALIQVLHDFTFYVATKEACT